MSEMAWLIETASGEYWNGRKAGEDAREAFVKDPNAALRFARFEDAETVRCWLFGQPGRGLGWSLRSVQHMWMDGINADEAVARYKERLTEMLDGAADRLNAAR